MRKGEIGEMRARAKNIQQTKRKHIQEIMNDKNNSTKITATIHISTRRKICSHCKNGELQVNEQGLMAKQHKEGRAKKKQQHYEAHICECKNIIILCLGRTKQYGKLNGSNWIWIEVFYYRLERCIN